MQALENNTLFTDISAEESAVVSGGLNFDINSYLFIVGAGVVFGNAGLTANELQYAWEQSISL